MKKIVFDLGNVIVRFDPMEIYHRYVNTHEEAMTLYDILMATKLWEKLDAGVDPLQVIQEAQQNADESLHYAIEQLIHTWTIGLEVDKQMEEFIIELYQQGIDLYLLSNASRQIHDFLGEHSLFSLMKGHYVSADTQLVKPQATIYEHFCEAFDLNPQDLIFIDDRLENIQAAKQQGWDTYHYTFDLDDLKNYIEQQLNK